MKQTVVKLVDAIIDMIQDNPEVEATEKGIRSWLLREGYNKRDIDAALKMVRPRIEVRPRASVHARLPIRALSPSEERKLAPEARDALARLEVRELIAPQEREMILERLNHFDGEVGLAELDCLLAWIVYTARDVESQQTIYNALEDARHTLH